MKFSPDLAGEHHRFPVKDFMNASKLFVICLILSRPLSADVPTDSDATTAIIGQPVALLVDPTAITLAQPRANQQIIVTGRYADGTLRDLTRFSTIKVRDTQLLVVTSDGLATGLNDGQTQIEIHTAGLSASIPVTITHARESRPISFRREFMPILSVAGCSDIRCHGAPSGKNGFRLSLWGHNPTLDYHQLTHDVFGRRTNSVTPDESLIVLKATGRIPHVGQQRFGPDSNFATLFRDWQSQGLHDSQPEAELRSISVTPQSRVLHAPAQWQQLAVQATYADGHISDVTRLTAFSTSDLAVAKVDQTGLVEFDQQGEVAIVCRFLGQMQSVRLMHIASPPKDYRWPDAVPNNFVDRHVFEKLKRLHVAPSDLCSDQVFIRRVFLDLCGTLPSPSESRSFADDKRPEKRSRLIDQLLHRPEYADYWTKKWLDVLRVSRDSIQLAGATAYQGWFRDHIKNDESFAHIVQELLTSRGDSFTHPAANFYCAAPMPRDVTDPQYLQKDLAETTAQLFLGIRLQCAQCHNHPYERWTQDDYLSLAAFFTQVKRTRLGKAGPTGRPERRQISVALDLKSPDLVNPSSDAPVAPHVPGESPLTVTPDQDRRKLLANWLTSSNNPFFSKAVVNRVWFHLHGKGIVSPVDDFRDSNPASNDALLDALAEDFVANGFKLKSLIRAITNSRTYQLSAVPNRFNRGDTRYFSHMRARPLPAEVLLDAICEVTGVPELFEISKDYTIGLPDGAVKFQTGTRAVQLPVTDIATLINTSGKYVRYELHPFLRTFGQPKRAQTCECDREPTFGRKQALELIVGPLLAAKLTQPDNRLGKLLSDDEKSNGEILEELYLRALSRSPSTSAANALHQHIETSTNRRQAWEDVLWTVFNSQEFIYQH